MNSLNLLKVIQEFINIMQIYAESKISKIQNKKIFSVFFFINN